MYLGCCVRAHTDVPMYGSGDDADVRVHWSSDAAVRARVARGSRAERRIDGGGGGATFARSICVVGGEFVMGGIRTLWAP